MNASFDFKFGRFKIPKTLVIYSSKHFFTMFPPNGRLKGHLLIISKKDISSLSEMSNEEVFDYSLTLQYIMKRLELYYNTNSSCVHIQEADDMRTNISQFHAHVIPRIKGDIQDHNEIYDKMPSFDEEFIKEYSELMLNEKNFNDVKASVDKFKVFIVQS